MVSFFSSKLPGLYPPVLLIISDLDQQIVFTIAHLKNN